ncbi:MAG: hypothetical protein ACOH2B_12060 [Burkholderiaceae bacterium]
MKLSSLLDFARQIRHMLHCAFTEWINHRAASKDAALAFYILFSITPILLLVIAFADFFTALCANFFPGGRNSRTNMRCIWAAFATVQILYVQMQLV